MTGVQILISISQAASNLPKKPAGAFNTRDCNAVGNWVGGPNNPQSEVLSSGVNNHDKQNQDIPKAINLRPH